MSATVLSVATRAVLDACAALGLPTDEILAKAGISTALIGDADARIPAERADAVWVHAFALANDPNLALHAAEALPFGAYKVLDFIGANAPTIGEGLSRVARYFPIVDPRGSLSVAHDGGLCRVTMESVLGTLPAPAQEYTLAALVLRSRASVGQSWPLARVEFTFDAPPIVAEHERIFSSEIRFNQTRAAIVVPVEAWETPVSGANAALFGVLEDHASRLLAEVAPLEPPGLLSRLRAVIREELRGGDIQAAHIARRLGLGERTLQRRLRDQELTFVEYLARCREQMAKEYLEEAGISLAEIAWLLGFADQSSFTRAFRRWTGKTPGEWRAMPT